MVEGSHLRALREQRGWTQQQAASRLRVTQAYLSMLESGRRPVPPRLLNVLVRAYGLPTTKLPLPAVAAELGDAKLARAIAALGYPGFGHLRSRPGRVWNPAEVLAAALLRPSLEARLVEALPWLALEYFGLEWPWLVGQAKLHDRQNRLGYVVLLARRLAEKSNRPDDTCRRLREVEQILEPSRLAREDAFAGDALTETERRWLRQRRPAEARHWNLLTDLTTEQLPYAS